MEMAPSVVQLESAGTGHVQVVKDAMKSQGKVTESEEEVADKVRDFIYFNSCGLTLRSRLGAFIPLLPSVLRRRREIPQDRAFW